MSEEDKSSASGTQPEGSAKPKVLQLDTQTQHPPIVHVLDLSGENRAEENTVPHVLALEAQGEGQASLAPTILSLPEMVAIDEGVRPQVVSIPAVSPLPEQIVGPEVLSVPAVTSECKSPKEPAVLFGGSVRQPTMVRFSDLMAVNGTRFSSRVVEQSLHIVQAQDLLRLPVTVSSDFGVAAQSEYTTISGQVLALAGQVQVANLQRALAQLASLFETFRLSRLLSGNYPKQLVGVGTKPATPQGMFERYYAQIGEAVEQLERARAEVVRIHDEYLRMLTELHRVRQDLEAYLLALGFWSQRLFEESLKEQNSLHPEAQHILAQRQRSLEASLEGLAEGQPTLDYYTQRFMELLDGAAEVLFAELPLWRTNCLGVFLLPSPGEALASTELRTTERMQDHLVAFLKRLI